jgi:hypothetical protein
LTSLSELGEDRFDCTERIVPWPQVMRREKAFEQRTGIDRPGSRDDLQKLAEPREQQQRERNGGQQALER